MKRFCKHSARLLETLFEEITAACFFDPRITKAAVRIEKLDRYHDIAGIGIEMVRERREQFSGDSDNNQG